MIPTILSLVGGIGSQLLSYGIQKNTSQEFQRMQHNYNEYSANNAYDRAKSFYQQFQSPSALLKQYKEAGLSPSMMFGGTPGTSGSAQAPSATTGLPSAPQLQPMDIASITLANAQAEKLNAETEILRGQNERGKLEIKQIDANITKAINEAKTEESKANLTSLQAQWQQFVNKMNEEANKDGALTEQLINEANEVKYRALKEGFLADIEKNNLTISTETVSTAIDLAKQQLVNLKAIKDLTDEQKEQLSRIISVEYAKINNNRNEWKANLNNSEAKWKAELDEQVKQWAKENNIKASEFKIKEATAVITTLISMLKVFI